MTNKQFEIHPSARLAIDKLANELVLQIEEHPERRKSDQGFKTKRPISYQIRDEDIIGVPIFGDTKDGKWVSRYSYRNDHCIGLSEKRYQLLREIVDQFLKVKWVRNSISEKFLEDEILNWTLDGFNNPSERSCVDEIVAKAKVSIQNFTLTIPLAFIEVESAFQFGIVSIAPIEKEWLDERESRCISLNRENEGHIKALFARTRAQLQGLASIVIRVEAESSRAQERALEVADAAVALLRIFSPLAYSPFRPAPYALLGSEHSPTTTVISVDRDERFGMFRATNTPGQKPWLISTSRWCQLMEMGLQKVSGLIDDTDLNDFDRDVRVGLMTFSKGLTFSDVGDRLVYALSSLEGLLLRDGSEPIQQNVGERMAFLIEKSGVERRRVVQNLKAVYKIRSQYIHHRVSVSEEQDLEVFWRNLFKVLITLIDNTGRFSSRMDFVNAVDNIKFGN